MKQPVSSLSSISNRAALSHEDLRGVFLPIPTPFDTSGAVDLRALGENIRRWSATGIDGFVLLGSTGERVHLDEREYLEVIEAAANEVETISGQREKPLLFIVGAGQQSTVGTLKEIRRVANAVATDAFLVITPHFYRPSITQEALQEHYYRVANESPVPIILYSMPMLTGVKIEPATAAALSQHEKIIGIKDSSADVDGLRETIKLVAKDFAVLTGNGTVLNEALSAGACGGILAVGCVAPLLCREIYQAGKAGESELATQMQTRLTPLAQAVTTRYGIGGLKAALDLLGYTGGSVRAPLRAPDESARAEIAQCLKAANSKQ